MADMILVEVTFAELELLKESLKYSRRAKEDYDGYPAQSSRTSV